MDQVLQDALIEKYMVLPNQVGADAQYLWCITFYLILNFCIDMGSDHFVSIRKCGLSENNASRQATR